MPPQQAPSYTASPLGNFPELSQMYATSFSTPTSNARLQVENAQDRTAVENAKAAQAAAEKQAAAFADPKYYTIQHTDNGGFKFYGPDGKEVTASQFANNTGQKLTDVLKDSQDPIDIRYIQDQKNLTTYLQAKAQSKFDPKQRAIAQGLEDQVGKAYGINLAEQNPSNLIQLMQQNYPTIYGYRAPGFSGSNLFISSPQNLYNQTPGGESAFTATAQAGQGSSGKRVGH